MKTCVAATITAVTLLPAMTPAKAEIPLCAGLTVVTAVSQPDGDYESIKQVLSADADGVEYRYSSARNMVDEFSGSDEPKLVRIDTTRRVPSGDLDSATTYLVTFRQDIPALVPKTTALGVSSAVLKALKNDGKVALGVIQNVYPGPSLDPSALTSIYSGRVEYALNRVPKPTTMVVLVNGRPTELPVIQAEGEFFGDKADFTILDDPRHPIALQFRIGIGSHAEINQQLRAAGVTPTESDDRDSLRVVRISHNCEMQLSGGPDQPGAAEEGPDAAAELKDRSNGNGEGLADTIEDALLQGETVDIYDIYFEFNSADLLPESEPTLKIIASLMQKHPEWKLAVGGHTDAIASDSFNLALSKRRANAVVKALNERFAIDATRFKSDGFGEAQPRDTNETLEGRARNRRVELRRM